MLVEMTKQVGDGRGDIYMMKKKNNGTIPFQFKASDKEKSDIKTRHSFYYESSAGMSALDSESVNLVVTSPPYPMIEMWDGVFCSQNPQIRRMLDEGRGAEAFESMHVLLDFVWGELYRVLKPGGLVCLNIGDAARTVEGFFALHANHSRIQSRMTGLGFSCLPAVIWRKQTNAPNKFMGSGMYPPGAYVTLEHEYILIFRKGPIRKFSKGESVINRRASAYFWEERNQWFSDVWMDLKGASQIRGASTSRSRTGAFPFELPYRLISMFSVIEDLVLDPFAGTGTTAAAAAALGRNSIGYEIDEELKQVIGLNLTEATVLAEKRLQARLNNHLEFVKAREASGYAFKYINRNYNFPVMTRQEKDLSFPRLMSIYPTGDAAFEAIYEWGRPENPAP